MRYILPFLLIPLLGFSPSVVNVHLVSVSGPYALEMHAIELFQLVRLRTRETGKNIRIKKFTAIGEDPTLGQSAKERYEYWKEQGKLKRWSKGVDIVHVVLSPLVIDEGRYVAGLTQRCGEFGVSFLTDFNHNGEDRLPASICAITHEFGHALGASDSFDLMDIDALRYSSLDTRGACAIPWARESIREIRHCH